MVSHIMSEHRACQQFKSSRRHYKWPANSNQPRVQHTGVIQSLLYTLRILRSHSIPEALLHDVFHAAIISKLTYCTLSWFGACSAADRTKMESFISRCKRLGYCSYNQPSDS